MPLNTWLIRIDAGDRTTLMAMDEGRRIVTHELSVDHPAEPSDSAKSQPLNADIWATAIAQQLRTMGHLPDQPVALALPSDGCYWANLSTQGLRSKQRRQALTYRFEEQLPLAAEELVCDFDIHHTHAFAVAVAIQSIEPMVQALQKQGLLIHLITPAAWLALGSLPFSELSSLDVVLIVFPPTWELWILRQGHPVGWYRSSQPDASGLVLPIQQLAEQQGKTKLQARRLGELQRSLPKELQSWLEIPSDEHTSLPSAMMAALANHSQQNQSLGINLRRDALAEPNPLRQVRRPLIAAISGIIALLLILPITFGWRSYRYHQLAKHYQQSQQAIFVKQYPGQAVPINITSRLTSERQRWQAMTGGFAEQGGEKIGGGGGGGRGGGGETMYQCLRRLPTDLRYRLVELRIDGDKLYLEGQTKSHSDAEMLATALRRAVPSPQPKPGKTNPTSPGFVVEPPRSDQMADGTVAFSLVAYLPAASSANRSEPKP